jgi:ribose-phosphate pyrophosphokinase
MLTKEHVCAMATQLPTSLTISSEKRLMLFSGRANRALAQDVAKELGVGLGGVELKTFSGGEVYCRYEESVRGADVFIVQPTCANAAEGLTPNDSLMELLLLIDAAKGASARRVIAVMPWFGYARQDKKSASREPISARVVARSVEAAGADGVLVMDLHSAQTQSLFSIPCDHVSSLPVLTHHLSSLGLEDLVVVSPDAGRVKLNKRAASLMGADLAILNKERPADHEPEITYVIGDVKGRPALIIDDMIDTAGTLKAASQAVLAEGARDVRAAATHGVFSGEASRNLEEAGLREIVVMDTIPSPRLLEGVSALSSAPLLAGSIRNIFTDDSVSAVG